MQQSKFDPDVSSFTHFTNTSTNLLSEQKASNMHKHANNEMKSQEKQLPVVLGVKLWWIQRALKLASWLCKHVRTFAWWHRMHKCPHHVFMPPEVDKVFPTKRSFCENFLSRCNECVTITAWTDHTTHSQSTQKLTSTNRAGWVLRVDHSSVSLPFITCLASCENSWIEISASAEHLRRASLWWSAPPPPS